MCCFTEPLDKYLKESSPNQGALDCSVWVEMQQFQDFKSLGVQIYTHIELTVQATLHNVHGNLMRRDFLATAHSHR